jgi:hypothetical protein
MQSADNYAPPPSTRIKPRWAEWWTESLQVDGIYAKYANRNVLYARDLRLDRTIPKLDVAGSNPVSRFRVVSHAGSVTYAG